MSDDFGGVCLLTRTWVKIRHGIGRYWYFHPIDVPYISDGNHIWTQTVNASTFNNKDDSHILIHYVPCVSCPHRLNSVFYISSEARASDYFTQTIYIGIQRKRRCQLEEISESLLLVSAVNNANLKILILENKRKAVQCRGAIILNNRCYWCFRQRSNSSVKYGKRVRLRPTSNPECKGRRFVIEDEIWRSFEFFDRRRRALNDGLRYRILFVYSVKNMDVEAEGPEKQKTLKWRCQLTGNPFRMLLEQWYLVCLDQRHYMLFPLNPNELWGRARFPRANQACILWKFIGLWIWRCQKYIPGQLVTLREWTPGSDWESTCTAA